MEVLFEEGGYIRTDFLLPRDRYKWIWNSKQSPELLFPASCLIQGLNSAKANAQALPE